MVENLSFSDYITQLVVTYSGMPQAHEAHTKPSLAAAFTVSGDMIRSFADNTIITTPYEPSVKRGEGDSVSGSYGNLSPFERVAVDIDIAQNGLVSAKPTAAEVNRQRDTMASDTHLLNSAIDSTSMLMREKLAKFYAEEKAKSDQPKPALVNATMADAQAPLKGQIPQAEKDFAKGK